MGSIVFIDSFSTFSTFDDNQCDHPFIQDIFFKVFKDFWSVNEKGIEKTYKLARYRIVMFYTSKYL